MKADSLQNIFMVFFAILWGALATVQPRWRAFRWPLIFRVPKVGYRLALAILLLNVAPIIYFA
jgi:hypothetical protein